MIRRDSRIEPLEARIAPATLIDARTVIFTDSDGDLVTIKFTKDVFTGTDVQKLAQAAQVFTFDTGTVEASAGENPPPQQLRLVDLTKFPISASLGSSINGVGMSITAAQAGTSDGLVDVGAIKATGVSAGVLVVDGDLGQIDAGGSGLRIGLAGLTVNSLGLRGVGSQIPVPVPTETNPAPDLISTITGELTALNVLTDIKDAQVKVVDGKNSSDQITTAANLGRLTVGGRIFTTSTADNSASVESSRAIGTVVVGGLFGGAGNGSGRISALQGGITSVTINGDLSGGGGFGAGQVFAFGSIGTLLIGDDLKGGSGEESGIVRSFGTITTATIGDDIIADTGRGSASISALGLISRLLVKGDIDATAAVAGVRSANVHAGSGMASVTVLGNIFGGAGMQSAVIESDRTMGTVVIGKSLVGAGGDGSGSIVSHGAITSITVKEDIIGGAGRQSGAVISGIDPEIRGDLGTVAVWGKVMGGLGVSSGAVISGGGIRSLTLGKLPTLRGAPLDAVVEGGQGNGSGSISALGAITTLKINGDLHGGIGAQSGSILAEDRIRGLDEAAGSVGAATLAGRLIGGDGARSGSLIIDGSLRTLTAGGIMGGRGAGSGSVWIGEGTVAGGDAGTITLKGGISQSTTPGTDAASVVTTGKLGSLTIKGAVDGARIRVGLNATAITITGDVSSTLISAFGQAVQGAKVDLALSRLTIGGSVDHSTIRAGYDVTGAAANPDAQIGTVSVKRDWIASSLVAGATVGADNFFGTADDGVVPGVDNAAIVSSIARIVIGGNVEGTGIPGEYRGIVAQLVRSVKIGKTTIALDALPNGQVFEIGGAVGGVAIREIALATP